jgi:leader peptidase (prepilin peptidase)/N-methyltransferase
VAVTAILTLFAGLFGLAIGSFLNVVIYRVPAGISLTRESRCPQCDSSIKPWQNFPVVSWLVLRGRCAHCGARISARYPLVEAFTAFAFAGVTWYFLTELTPTTSASEGWALGAVVVAYLYFAAVSIALALIDLDTRRLPNVIVLPSYLVAGALLTVATALAGTWGSLLRAAIAMAGLYAFYFLLRVIRPGGMGGGDVKLAGLVGLYLGWISWSAVLVGAFAAFLIGGVVGVALLAMRKAGRKSAIPFGPFMLLGAWTGVFAGDVVGQVYLSLYSGT